MANFNFDEPVNRFNTNSYKWDKYPADVIPLWVADMDFKAAPPILEALQREVNHGVIGYTHTPDELVDVALKHLKTHHNWEVQPEWLIWLPGMVPAIHTVARMLGEDDYTAVMTSTPVYHPFLHAAEHGKRRLQGVPFKWANNRWEMDFEQMERTASPSTKLYMLCNPHNPNGRVFSREELEQLAEFCTRRNLLLMSDEIHCDLVLDSTKQHVSIATLSEEMAQRTVTLLAPSKTYNIAGLGCTFAVIPNPKLREKFEEVRFGMMPAPTSFAYEAALAAYKSCADWKEDMLNYLRGNHDFLMEKINAIPGLKMTPLEATYLAWIDFRELNKPDFVTYLADHGVGVHDASVFGGEGFFRLNFGTQRSVLAEAVRRIEKAVMMLRN